MVLFKLSFSMMCPHGISKLFIMCWHQNVTNHRTVYIIFNIYVLIQIDLFIMLLSILKSHVTACTQYSLSGIYLKNRAFFPAVTIHLMFSSCFFFASLTRTLHFCGAMNIFIRTFQVSWMYLFAAFFFGWK